MNIPGYLYVECISLLASLNLFLRKSTPLYLKLFFPYLLITLVVEIIGWRLLNERVDTAFLIYPFSAFEFEFYFFALYHIIRTRFVRQIIRYILFIYPILAVTIIYFIQANTFPTFAYLLGCLLVSFACIFYFYELFHLPVSVNLLREPPFWICTALLFYYICSLPLYGLYSRMYDAPGIILQNITVVLTVMNVLLYTLFTVAFLCVRGHLRVPVRR